MALTRVPSLEIPREQPRYTLRAPEFFSAASQSTTKHTPLQTLPHITLTKHTPLQTLPHYNNMHTPFLVNACTCAPHQHSHPHMQSPRGRKSHGRRIEGGTPSNSTLGAKKKTPKNSHTPTKDGWCDCYSLNIGDGGGASIHADVGREWWLEAGLGLLSLQA